jgi:hypothetical protein
MKLYRVFRATCSALLMILLFADANADSAAQQQPSSASSALPADSLPQSHDVAPPVFSEEELTAFLAAAGKADEMKDPMKRCVDFPNPPGSHWSGDGIEAFCRYMLQPTMELSEFDRLIQEGNAKELDARFTAWEADAHGHPNAFLRFLMVRFAGADPARQPLIESWKQQSPDSAFAFALSGWNYSRSGWAARGSRVASETSQANFAAMENAMERARGDLERAVRLNPQLVAAYTAMMDLGMAAGDQQYVRDAAAQGVSVPGGKYPVFSALAMYTSARWYGSPQAQLSLLSDVRKWMPKEPLLHVVPAIVLCMATGIDDHAPQDGQWAVYRTALDDMATHRMLYRVGMTALRHHQDAVAYVYLSEAVRFAADDRAAIDARARAATLLKASQLRH